MLTKVCTKCGIEKSLDEFPIRNDNLSYRGACRSCWSEYGKDYRKANEDRIKKRFKEFYDNNKELCSDRSKRHYRRNKSRYSDRHREYRRTNHDKLKATLYSPAMYEPWSKRISYADEVRDCGGLLEAKCAYCNKWFAPTLHMIRNRVRSLTGTRGGENRLYCSTECKQACPTFHRKKYERGHELSTSREVPAEFRKMALKDRNYTCEKCGSTENGLHVHHINGYSEAPMLAADLCNVLVVCKKCHKEIHKQPGCSYSDYGLCKITK